LCGVSTMFGSHFFIGAHAFVGEMGALCFLWALVEIINRTEASLARARIAGVLGVALLFFSLVVGGYPYVTFYGPVAKPIIVKAGSMKWAHDVITEAKEHIAILIPIVALATTLSMFVARKEGTASAAYRNIAVLCGLVVVMVFSMAGMGFIISTAIRLSLPGGV
jgi:hypothetical protein